MPRHNSWMSWNLFWVCRSQVQMKWTVVMFIINKLVNKTEDSQLPDLQHYFPFFFSMWYSFISVALSWLHFQQAGFYWLDFWMIQFLFSGQLQETSKCVCCQVLSVLSFISLGLWHLWTSEWMLFPLQLVRLLRLQFVSNNPLQTYLALWEIFAPAVFCDPYHV